MFFFLLFLLYLCYTAVDSPWLSDVILLETAENHCAEESRAPLLTDPRLSVTQQCL